MFAEVTPDTVLAPCETLAWQEVAGEVVLLDLDSHVLRGLSPSGGRVWQLLDGKRTLGAIAAELVARYRIPEERALADVLAFARELVARKLASASAPGP